MAVLITAAAIVAISVAAVIAYTTFVGIESAIKERKEKKGKK
jgi:hypothetical protein